MGGWEVGRVGDQSGRVVVVTGANSGVGQETARALVAHGAHVIMACRDVGKGEAARRRLPSDPGTASVEQVDLADLDSVARSVDRLAGNLDRIDALVCNAGIMGGASAASAQGYERQMATNHLGHFALTARLWPLLTAAPAARVVVVSSLAARGGQLSPGLERDTLVAPRPYHAGGVYSNTKQANLLFAQELHRRASTAGLPVRAVAAHPGVSASNLFPRQLRESGLGFLAPAAALVLPLVLQSARAGALPPLRAVSDPDIPSGAFVGPTALFGTRGAPHVIDVFSTGTDQVTAERLWQVSEELVGLRFDVARS